MKYAQNTHTHTHTHTHTYHCHTRARFLPEVTTIIIVTNTSTIIHVGGEVGETGRCRRRGGLRVGRGDEGDGLQPGNMHAFARL
jgi:hypothetical protein